MISIVQYFYVIPGGGGNMYYIFSKTLNADLKNKMLIDNNSFAFSNEKIGKINRQLVDYFNNAFPEEVEYLNYPEIEKSKNEDYNIAFKNDSLVLVIEAYPSAHYTYQTYIVPIEKFVLK
jgi:predicted secreted protein